MKQLESSCSVVARGLISCLVLVMAISVGVQAADPWPTEPITIIAASGAGSATDRQARVLAPILSDILGVPVQVENRPGGGTLLATRGILREPADGSRILYSLIPHFLIHAVDGQIDLHEIDILGFTQIAGSGVIVRADSPYQTAPALFEAIRNNPGQISVGITTGGGSQLAAALMEEILGSKMRLIPFDGGDQQRVALLAGDVDFVITPVEQTLATMADEVTVLAALVQSSIYPEIPTLPTLLKEYDPSLDFPDIFNAWWFGMNAEFRKRHPDRYDTLVQALEKAATSERFLEWGRANNLPLRWYGPEEAAELAKAKLELLRRYRDYF